MKNTNIKYGDIIEYITNKAHEELVYQWKRLNLPADKMEYENQYGGVSFSDKAREMFNEIFDDMENELLCLEDKNPHLTLQEIIKLLEGEDNENR